MTVSLDDVPMQSLLAVLFDLLGLAPFMAVTRGSWVSLHTLPVVIVTGVSHGGRYCMA